LRFILGTKLVTSETIVGSPEFYQRLRTRTAVGVGGEEVGGDVTQEILRMYKEYGAYKDA